MVLEIGDGEILCLSKANCGIPNSPQYHTPEMGTDRLVKNRCTHEEPSLVLRPGSWIRPSKDLLNAVKQRHLDSPTYVIP